MPLNILVLIIFATISFSSASNVNAASRFITDNTPLWTTTDTNTTSNAPMSASKSISTVSATTSFATMDSVSLGSESSVTSQTTSTPVYQAVRYGYDEFNRLKWAQYEDGTLISYDYDKVGNRITRSVDNGTTTSSFTVTATSSGNGMIVPSGTLSLPSGSSQTFLLRPNPGVYTYVKIDGVSVSDYPYVNCFYINNTPYPSRNIPCMATSLSNLPTMSHTFQSISANHSISVEFITPDGDLNGDGIVNASDTAIANSYIQYHSGGWFGPSYYLYYPMPFNMLAHADVYSYYGYLQPDAKFDLGDAYGIGLMAQGQTFPSPWPQSCTPPNYPARLVTVSPQSFLNHLSLQSAYNAASGGDTIQGNMYPHFESLLLDRNVAIALSGGYTCDYLSSAGSLNVRGSITISGGPVTISGTVVISNP